MLSPSTGRPVNMPRVGGFYNEEIVIEDGRVVPPQWQQTIPFCGGTNFRSKSEPESTHALRPPSLVLQGEFERACGAGLIAERRLSLDAASSPLLSKVWQATLWSAIKLLGLDPVFWIIKDGTEYNILKQFDALTKEDVDAHVQKLKNGGLPWPNENGGAVNHNNAPCEFDLYNLKWSGILLQNSIGVDLYARLISAPTRCLLNYEDASGPEWVFAIGEIMVAMQQEEQEQLPSERDQPTAAEADETPTLAMIVQQLNDLQALVSSKLGHYFNNNSNNHEFQSQRLQPVAATDPRTSISAFTQPDESSERQESDGATSEHDPSNKRPNGKQNGSSVSLTAEAATSLLYPPKAVEQAPSKRRVYTKQELLKLKDRYSSAEKPASLPAMNIVNDLSTKQRAARPKVEEPAPPLPPPPPPPPPRERRVYTKGDLLVLKNLCDCRERPTDLPRRNIMRFEVQLSKRNTKKKVPARNARKQSNGAAAWSKELAPVANPVVR